MDLCFVIRSFLVCGLNEKKSRRVYSITIWQFFASADQKIRESATQRFAVVTFALSGTFETFLSYLNKVVTKDPL